MSYYFVVDVLFIIILVYLNNPLQSLCMLGGKSISFFFCTLVHNKIKDLVILSSCIHIAHLS